MSATANLQPLQPLQFFIEQEAGYDLTPQDIFQKTSFCSLIRGESFPHPADLEIMLRSPLVFQLVAEAAETVIESDGYGLRKYTQRFWTQSSIDLKADRKRFTSTDGLWTVEVLSDGSAKLGLVTNHPLFFNAVCMLCAKMRMVGLDYYGEIEGVEIDQTGRTIVSGGLLLQDFTLPISPDEWALVTKAADGTFRIYLT